MHRKNVAVITTCTSRKMHATARCLDLSVVSSGGIEDVLSQWCQTAISTAADRFPAREVYRGRSFLEARRAAEAVAGRLYIVSAGFGFLGLDESIPLYDLTITGNGASNVKKKVEGKFLEREWWAGVNRHIRGDETPISNMVKRSPSKVFVFALSSPYYRLIEGDILAIPRPRRVGLRLLGLGLNKVVDRELSEYVLPYDERFDGPDSPIRGTRGNFAQRAARHFVSELVARGVADLEEQKRRIVRWQSKWRAPGRPKRERMGDEEILAFLRKTAKKVSSGGYTRMLRTFRDMGYCCEQKRFAALYRKATADGDAGTSSQRA